MHKIPKKSIWAANGWGIRRGGEALVLIGSNTVFYTAVACMPLLEGS
jgi:hypothetical protein